MRRKYLSTAAMVTIGALLLTGCGGNESGADSGGDDTLTLWHFEGENSAMGIAWDQAIETFEKETGAKVEFERKSFEQIRSTASQVLNSDEAPDVLEYTKGNATAGLLASQGLLTNLDSAVNKYGWDEKLAPSLQTTAMYNDEGIMGSGHWYGVPNYGEYVEVYYNKDMFEKYDIEVPETQKEFEAALQTFVDNGVTPLAEAGAEYPIGQLFYQFALSKADRQFVKNYQLYENPVDWHGPELTYAANQLNEYVEKGYISENVTGLKAEDMGVSFINGEFPMMYSGSWWYGRMIDEIKKFEWGTFLYPGSKMAPGSSGNLWSVPERSDNKELAYKFIDITMRPEIQALIGNNGGVPVAANPEDITDPKSQELIANFNELTENDGLAFYPDWPTPTFYDSLVASTQELINGSIGPNEMLDQLGQAYKSGVEDIK